MIRGWLEGTSCCSWMVVFILVRLFFGMFTRTSFHPDEYYQSVEPAYHLAHSDDTCVPHLTWEWEEKYMLRSHVSILPYYFLFCIKKYLQSSLLAVIVPYMKTVLTPRVLQSVLAIFSDIALHDMVTDVSGPSVASYFSCLNLCSWSLLYCLPRTLANSTEVILCVIVTWLWWVSHKLYVGHLPYCSFNSTIYFELMAWGLSVLTVYARPTSVLLLSPLVVLILYLHHCRKMVRNISSIVYVALLYIVVTVVMLSSCVYVDVWGYQWLKEKSCDFAADNNLSDNSWYMMIPPLNL